MPFVQNGDVRIRYEVEGAGAPLVLHHGYSGSLRDWYRNGYVTALQDRYRLILVDARGHGQSDKPHDVSAYALETRVGDVVSILDALGVERTLYCGFSMGGNVAYGLLTQRRERVAAAAILGADPSPYDTAEWNRIIGILEDGGMEAYAEETRSKGEGPDAEEARAILLAQDPRALIASKMDTRDWPGVAEAFAQVTAPTFMVAGDADPIYPLIAQAAASNAQSEMVTLPGLDHVATLRRSDLTLPLVRPFLARSEERIAAPAG